MDQECIIITKSILPAVRASIARIMKDKYGWSQERIAEKLGVVQVAVSKYINKKYSKEVAAISRYIDEKGIGKELVAQIIQGKSKTSINNEIDNICAEIMITGVINGRRTGSV